MWAARFLVERLTQEQWHELLLSDDPCDKIHNGQVLHYTRRDPATGECSRGFEWVRSSCPWAPARARSGWCRIKPPSFSNEDLLSALATTERLIPGPPVEPDRARAHRPA